MCHATAATSAFGSLFILCTAVPPVGTGTTEPGKEDFLGFFRRGNFLFPLGVTLTGADSSGLNVFVVIDSSHFSFIFPGLVFGLFDSDYRLR